MTENYAQWISPTSAIASSLETGDIVQITAWGGNEYGYAYTFALDSTAPANTTIGQYTGRINISSALSAGTYTFNIITTSMEAGAIYTFPFTLKVLTGVNGTIGTTVPADTSHIVHFAYDPGSGTWGSPTGNDWTSVFNSMQTQILADQTRCNAVWDESTRMDIVLQRATEYDYTNNQWTNGIQYFKIHDASTGALPILKCTKSTNIPQNAGPLNLSPTAGQGSSPGSIFQSTVKAHCATIATVVEGSKTVTLRNAGDASKIVVGRWHVILGNTQQIGGFPPNVQYIDYAKVTAISGTTVTLDRPLKYGYDQTWYENGSDDDSLGVGRIAPFDTGGTGGYIPATPRCIIRGNYTNLDFQADPNYTGGATVVADRIIGGGTAIDLTFSGCNLPAFQPTCVKHLYVKSCTATTQWELDKESETVIFDTITSTGQIITATTGYQYALFLNSTCAAIQVSPRQLRAISTSFSGVGDNPFPGEAGAVGPPITFAFNGPLNYWDIGSQGACTITKGPNDTHVFNAYNSSNNSASLTVGTDASFSGSQLQIPNTYANFEPWLDWSRPGSILSTVAAAPFSTNWGYVTSLSSDSTHLFLNVTWVNGSQPVSGTLYMNRFNRLLFASGNTLTSGTLWQSPGFAKETAPGDASGGWDYPSGYPQPGFEEAGQNVMAGAKTKATVTVSSAGTVAASGETLSVGKAKGFASPLSVGNLTISFVQATFSVGGLTPLLLDNLSATCTAAYSLRNIRQNYLGPCMNVRRSSDNATQDIIFNGNGDFDVTGFQKFVGAGTGFVTKWYDQSGNGYNAVQGTSNLQPQIALNIANGRPVINVTGSQTNMGLTATGVAANHAVISFSSVTSRTGAQTSFGLFISYDGNLPGVTYENSANGGISVGNANVSIIPATTCSDNAFHATVGILNGSGTQMIVDNGTPTTATLTGATGGTQIDICGRSSFQYIGYLAELFVFDNAALGSTDIATLHTSQSAYWGTP